MQIGGKQPMEPPYGYPPSLLGVGHAGTLDEQEKGEVMIWLPDPKSRTAWKSERWVSREKPQTSRPLGFGRK